jgi:hypothetical protein
VAVDVSCSKIDGYPKTGVGTHTIQQLDPKTSKVRIFPAPTSSQQGAHVAGVEVSYEQPIANSQGLYVVNGVTMPTAPAPLLSWSEQPPRTVCVT